MSPMNIAMRLLKAPIVDTDIPGVRMAYENEKSEPVIGNQPYMWGSDDKVENMTPNDYFDMLAIDEEKNGINNVNMGTAAEIPNKDASYRWDGRQFTQHGGSRDNIARIMQGIKDGMPIGMPELSFRNGEYDGVQEGGHRMEALRQMGHADTPVPVWRHHRTVRTGEPMDIVMRLLKHATSPEAKRHKSEYDSKYESTPERKKYHVDLNRERRKRGIYGQGGPDMSHTKEGTMVAEDPHINRARHFKERGTLKSVIVR